MNQPYVFSNLAISLDGKIATYSREQFQLGSARDIRLLRKLRNNADVVVMGAETLRTWKKPCIPIRKKKIYNSIVSRNLLNLDPNWTFFKSNKIQRILFVTGSVSRARLALFEKYCEVIRIDGRKSISKQIIRAHRERGLQNILIEGGGGLMSEFVQDNAIDRYYVTLTPRILGGKDAPTLVEGPGLPSARVLNLRLEKTSRVGSEIFLVYGKLEVRGKKHPLYSN